MAHQFWQRLFSGRAQSQWILGDLGAALPLILLQAVSPATSTRHTGAVPAVS